MNRNAYDELRAHVAAMDPRAWALIDARERGDFEQEAEIERLKAANGVLDRNYHHMRELRDAALAVLERLDHLLGSPGDMTRDEIRTEGRRVIAETRAASDESQAPKEGDHA